MSSWTTSPGPERTDDRGDVYAGIQNNSIIGGRENYNQVNNIVNNHNGDASPGSRGFDKLCSRIAVNALHNSGEVSDQPKCHEGTRIKILEFFLEWASNLVASYPIQWLHGPAGAGKSTILRTIAHLLHGRGLLLGCFFFSRSSEGRSSSKPVIATIAYQLARSIEETRQQIGEAVERNPAIFSLSLREQASALVVSPLVSVFYNPKFNSHLYPRVIIIDGLDECHDHNQQSELLRIFRRILKTVPIPLTFLIASRPEHHIRYEFDLPDLNICSSRLGLDNRYEPDADIMRYLVDRFDLIRQRRPIEFPPGAIWPPIEALNVLVAKASGQFIYASTVLKFVDSLRHNPVKRLNIILGALSAGKERPFEPLDNLYSTIFRTVETDCLDPALRVLGLLLISSLELPAHPQFVTSHSPAYLEHFLQLEPGAIRHLLFDLESLLTIHGNNAPIQFYHASLSDYLSDGSRSEEFWVDPGLIYADIAETCVSRGLYWDELRIFFAKNVRFISSNIRPTPQLRQAIECCNIAEMLSSSSDSRSETIRLLYPAVLKVASMFANAQEMLSINSHYFNQIIQERLRVYFSNSHLKCFLVILTLAYADGMENLPFGDPNWPLLYSKEWLLEVSEGFGITADLTSDGLLQLPPLLWLIKHLLDDRRGRYFINDIGFTNISVHLMQQCHRRYDPLGPFPLPSLNKLASLILPKSLIRSDLLEETEKVLDVIENARKDKVYPIRDFPIATEALETYVLRAKNSTRTERNKLLHQLAVHFNIFKRRRR